jgi:hypothetical protein
MELSIGVVAVIVFLAGGLLPVLVSTYRRKGNLGINFRRPKCPNCAHPFPIVRTPKNKRQALWGGWTCDQCGTEADKWGQPVSNGPTTG